MDIQVCSGWKDYELIDSGNGMRFERFGPYKTIRPDPQAIWKPFLLENEWQQADVRFVRTKADQGVWKFKRHLPEKWLMHWKDISFWTRLTSFKHTGIFPEQSLQWEFIQKKIKERIPTSQPHILNLFGYTGLASLAAASAGAKVTHVDASKPTLTWARDNQLAAHLEKKPIRWILDDAGKFVEREIRRGSTYDGIIMDPPVYGHGPTGQIWKFQEDFPKLLANCEKILSERPLFVVINAYAISASALMLQNVMQDILGQRKGNSTVGELTLQETASKRLLSTGIFGRWEGK